MFYVPIIEKIENPNTIGLRISIQYFYLNTFNPQMNYHLYQKMEIPLFKFLECGPTYLITNM